MMSDYIKRKSVKLLGICFILLILIPQFFEIPDSSSLSIVTKRPVVLGCCFCFFLCCYLYFLIRVSSRADSRGKRVGFFCLGLFLLLFSLSPYFLGLGRVVWVYNTWLLERKADRGDPLSQIRMSSRSFLNIPDRERALSLALNWAKLAKHNGLKGTEFYTENPLWFNPELYGSEESILTMAAYNLENSADLRSRAICALDEIYPFSVHSERKAIDRSLLGMFNDFIGNATYSNGLNAKAIAILKKAKIKSMPKPVKSKRVTPYLHSNSRYFDSQELAREVRRKLEKEVKERERKMDLKTLRSGS